MNNFIEWPGGEWKTVRMIGKGGYGSVYEIQREEFGRSYKAAMKVMKIPKDDSEIQSMIYTGMNQGDIRHFYTEYAKRLSEEFALLSTLKGYTNIVSYEDHKILRNPDGISWTILIRMELLTPVKKYFAEHKYNEETVIRLGTDICKALEICHARNIIHRDIKLDNMFVNENGDFELGDFGVARISKESMSTMTMIGTPGYMAPEIYRKERYGQTADIYSLGIAMYMLLNKMRGPFYPVDRRITPDDADRALECRMSGRPIPEPMYGAPGLKAAILKAISFRPEERYQSAEEFRRAFAENVKDDPLETLYRQAFQIARHAKNWVDYEKAEAVFRSMEDYRDCRECAERCRRLAEKLRNDEMRRSTAGSGRGAVPKANRAEMNPQREERDLSIREEYRRYQEGMGRSAARVPSRGPMVQNRVQMPESVKLSGAGKLPPKKKNRIANVIGKILFMSFLGMVIYMLAAGERIQMKQELEVIRTASIGDTVIFGKYSNDLSKKISWTVCAKEGDCVGLISSYIVKCMPFDEEASLNWASSSLREWLNQDFYNSVFSQNEKDVMIQMNVDDSIEIEEIEGEQATQDKVTCLSLTEMQTYWSTTEKGRTKSRSENDKWKAESYWLRPTNELKGKVLYIDSEGMLQDGTDLVASEDMGVVPVIIVDISALDS